MWFLIIAYWFVMSLVSSMFSRYLQGYNTVKSPPPIPYFLINSINDMCLDNNIINYSLH